ncbi:DUF983 domain-containing protein [Rhodoligotrophos defluvii]|uniref:DUF983 domain-containing protein n=1 Tax=Rhodoligotrophos defluvii TaxID=2561934 RepID=UPI0010C94562|nr:DUF983 domain-containing protein [Rhodoligotrophos defluvii]
MEKNAYHPPLNPVATGLRARCPRCGQGRLFQGYLGLAKQCPACGLNYDFADAGDGPAVFIILIAGFVVVGAALFTEVAYQPPYWVHAILWLPLILALTLGLLRPVKGILINQQFHAGAQEGRLGGGDEAA